MVQITFPAYVFAQDPVFRNIEKQLAFDDL